MSSAASINAFLLTRQRVETERGTDLVFWITTDNGPVRWQVSGQEAVCFIPARDAQRARRLLPDKGVRIGQTQLKSFAFEPMAAVYCANQRLLYDCRDRLQGASIPVHEADVTTADRYLMERFLTGAVELEMHSADTTRGRLPEVGS